MKIQSTQSMNAVTPHRPYADKGELKEGANKPLEENTQLESIGLTDSIDQSDSIDMDLVNHVKSQIAQGNVELDPKRLARAIMEMHSQ